MLEQEKDKLKGYITGKYDLESQDSLDLFTNIMLFPGFEMWWEIQRHGMSRKLSKI